MMNDLFAPPLSLLSAPVGQSIANQFNVKPGLDVDEDDDQLVLKSVHPSMHPSIHHPSFHAVLSMWTKRGTIHTDNL